MTTNTRPNDLLRNARLARHWTQTEVSELVEVTPITVGRWERGEAMPSRRKITELSNVFGLTPQELGLITNISLPKRPSGMGFFTDPMIPLPLSKTLIGRDALLEDIRQHLTGGSAAIALHGLPGVGKTTLALSLVTSPSVQDQFQDGILWAGLGPTPNIPEILSRWGALLGVAASGIGPSKSADIWRGILHEVIGARRILLVLDDVWNYGDIAMLNVGGPNCVYLATTRSPQLAVFFAMNEAISIPELSEENGVVLLEHLVPVIKTYDSEQVRLLVRSVGALPLALILAGKYLYVQGHSGQLRRLRSAMQRLLDRDQRLQLSESDVLVETHPSLSSGTSVSLQSVIAVSDHHLDEHSRQALRALSVFPAKPNTFSEEAALIVSAVSEEGLDVLTDSGLMEVNGAGRYTLHQAIADYARTSLTDQVPFQRLATYYGTYSEQNREDIDALDLESQNISAALEAAYALKRREDLVRGVCAFAHFLLLRGLYDQAEYHLRHARESIQGDAQMEEKILLPLGQTAQKRGDFTLAVNLFQQGLVLARQLGNVERISGFLADLGWVTWKQGHYHVAEEYLSEGLVQARQLGNAERICKILRVLGAVHSSFGNYPQAQLYLQEGLTLARQIDHREHICVLLIDLGVTFLEKSDAAQGLKLLQEGLILAQEIGHREWSSLVYLNLADEALLSKRYREGMEYTRKGLALSRQIGNREWTCAHLINLGMGLREREAFSDAEASFNEALIMVRELDRPYLHFLVFYEFGLLRLKQSEIEVAEKMFREASLVMPEGDGQLTGLLLFARARVEAKRGNLEQALALAQECRTIFLTMGSDRLKEVDQWLDVSFDTSATHT